VFHNLAGYSLVVALRDPHAPAIILAVPWSQRLSLLILTISAAAVSWHFHEKPLNDLKRLSHYNVPARGSQLVAEQKICRASDKVARITGRDASVPSQARRPRYFVTGLAQIWRELNI
jgi:peptidoglycan/LPS O-acetylase OafA/YrhL